MTVLPFAVAALTLLLAAGLARALVRQQDRHDRYTAALLDAFREERAQLINKISRPETPMSGPSARVVTPRRSPTDARERARVGTVAPPRSPDNGTSE